ncbi:MAG: efflux RND transporter periplasmic adaptor subunit [Thermodesulfobacteriota bacterium]|nr:efflux RND transporter periplasmic adaptor subunit [Thermodesulfobacteriota bacterium]
MQYDGIVYESIKRSIIMAALAGALLPAGCDRGPLQGPPPMEPPQVTVVTVQTEEVMLTTELPGRTSAFRVAEIRPQISGLILERLFEEGSDVKAGKVLYQIDPAPFQAALDNADAALSRAKANLPPILARVERYKELLTDKAVSQQDYDDTVAAVKQIQAEIESWKAQVETARINLGYTKIKAPIAGRIGRSNVTVGAIVTAYQPVALAIIQQLDPIYVDVPQSTTNLFRLKSRLQKGLLNQQGKDRNKVKLILEDDTAYPLDGTLQFSDITVDQTTGSVTMRALFPNPDGVLLPGMFVRAMIKEGINKQAILIPQQGVSRDPKGNPFALVVDAESKADFRPLILDRAIGDKWLVSSGLAPGDRVIVEGLLMLRPGTVVKATPFDPTQAGQDPVAGGPGAPPEKRCKGGD